VGQRTINIVLKATVASSRLSMFATKDYWP
jgi:hypothetical protein